MRARTLFRACCVKSDDATNSSGIEQMIAAYVSTPDPIRERRKVFTHALASTLAPLNMKQQEDAQQPR
ncbi:hypothetical protein ON010_g16364 [Phytophthora cinnamomi]|nr:hypothetical protein ON010_g16364 [Phytophthora cinnamomi]